MPPSHTKGMESLLSHIESNGPFCPFAVRIKAAKSIVNIVFLFIAGIFSLACCGVIAGFGYRLSSFKVDSQSVAWLFMRKGIVNAVFVRHWYMPWLQCLQGLALPRIGMLG